MSCRQGSLRHDSQGLSTTRSALMHAHISQASASAISRTKYLCDDHCCQSDSFSGYWPVKGDSFDARCVLYDYHCFESWPFCHSCFCVGSFTPQAHTIDTDWHDTCSCVMCFFRNLFWGYRALLATIKSLPFERLCDLSDCYTVRTGRQSDAKFARQAEALLSSTPSTRKTEGDTVQS